jgi:serine/threonine protein kinase
MPSFDINYRKGFATGKLIIDRYRIGHEIGGGGMCWVYAAADEVESNRQVVIKTPQAEYLSDEWVSRKFAQERESLSRLQHEGIVKLLGYGTTEENFPFIVLEYIDGVTLESIISDLAFDLPRCGKLSLQIAEAIDHSHNRGIFHRDLKPSNVMLTRESAFEQSKLIDFGIARVINSLFSPTNQTRFNVGTPYYISPNRWDGKPDDQADDLYAFALVVYQMLTGRNPLQQAENELQLVDLQTKIPPPGIYNRRLPFAVDEELMKALAINPLERHRTVLEFGQKLAKFLMAKNKSTSGKIKPKSNPSVTPKRVNVYTGEEYFQPGNLETAIAEWTKAIESNPSSDFLLTRRGISFLLKNDFENARQDALKALKINSQNDLALLIQALVFFMQGLFDLSVADLTRIGDLNPTNLPALLVLGDIYFIREEPQRAIENYSKLLQINPEFSWGNANRGIVFYDLKDYEKAIQDFTAAINLNLRRDWIYHYRGKSFHRLGQLDFAVADFTAAINLSPKPAKIYHDRAKAYFKMGELTKANEDFEQANQIFGKKFDKNFAEEKNALTALQEYLLWISK